MVALQNTWQNSVILVVVIMFGFGRFTPPVKRFTVKIVCELFEKLHDVNITQSTYKKDLHWLPVHGRLDYKIAVLSQSR